MQSKTYLLDSRRSYAFHSLIWLGKKHHNVRVSISPSNIPQLSSFVRETESTIFLCGTWQLVFNNDNHAFQIISL